MKKSHLAETLLSFFLFLSVGVFGQSVRHLPDTERLITMVEHNSELKQLLTESIAKAKATNPDRVTNPAQTLDEYYAFIDRAATALPWTILPSGPDTTLYNQIDQSLDYFYFVNDQPLDALKHKGYYHNSLQYHEPYRTWLIEFTKKWGFFLSQEGSWCDAYYRRALADPSFGLQRGWYEDPSHWKTFNEFFARYLKSPDQRPIASPGDASVVAAPADSKPQGVWAIDEHSNLVGVTIKSNTFKSIAVLIGEGSAYKDAFASGTLTHTFLDVNDYHRYHTPIAGTVKEVRLIPADDAVGGIISWDPKAGKYLLDASNPGWQNIETRGCVILETPEYGLVALLPIGMSQVSSVNFEETIKPGDTLKKGDMLGYFLFGGSDFVMIFQKGVKFTLTVPPTGNGAYSHVLMGEKYGELSKASSAK